METQSESRLDERPFRAAAHRTGAGLAPAWLVGGSLATNIKTVLERLPGVRRATVSREKAEARVEYDDEKMTPEKLVAAIGRLGFQARLLSVADGSHGR